MTETTRVVFVRDGPNSITAVLGEPKTLTSIRELFANYGPYWGRKRNVICTIRAGVAHVVFEQPGDDEKLARVMGVIA